MLKSQTLLTTRLWSSLKKAASSVTILKQYCCIHTHILKYEQQMELYSTVSVVAHWKMQFSIKSSINSA